MGGNWVQMLNAGSCQLNLPKKMMIDFFTVAAGSDL